MDILAHSLWTNYGAQVAKKKSVRIHIGWATFWGIFPDLFAFAIPIILRIFTEGQFIFGKPTVSGLPHELYNYSHSLVIWALVFLIVWAISRRPRWELLGWALHILIDIPSHIPSFYPTPFLFPLSEYRFPYGIQWSNIWYMIINYTALGTIWGGIILRSIRRKTHDTTSLKS